MNLALFTENTLGGTFTVIVNKISLVTSFVLVIAFHGKQGDEYHARTYVICLSPLITNETTSYKHNYNLYLHHKTL